MKAGCPYRPTTLYIHRRIGLFSAGANKRDQSIRERYNNRRVEVAGGVSFCSLINTPVESFRCVLFRFFPWEIFDGDERD